MRHFYGTNHRARGFGNLYLVPKQVPTDEKQVKEVILVSCRRRLNCKSSGGTRTDRYAIETASAVQEPDRLALETLERYRASNTRELEDILACLDRIRRLKGTAA